MMLLGRWLVRVVLVVPLVIVVALALNPVESRAVGRDKERVGLLRRVGSAVGDYKKDNEDYPPRETWRLELTEGQYINSVPEGFEYAKAEDGVIVYFGLEAPKNNRKCGGGEHAWAVYSSVEARAGTVCSAVSPTPGKQSFID